MQAGGLVSRLLQCSKKEMMVICAWVIGVEVVKSGLFWIYLKVKTKKVLLTDWMYGMRKRVKSKISHKDFGLRNW